jgi:hypothetical protein
MQDSGVEFDPKGFWRWHITLRIVVFLDEVQKHSNSKSSGQKILKVVALQFQNFYVNLIKLCTRLSTKLSQL